MNASARHDAPIRVAYVIDQMGVGGTERQLATLINGLDFSRFAPYLFTIHEYEKCFDLACELRLYPTSKLLSPNGMKQLLRMASAFRRENIQIVQTFFVDATCMGIPAARLARVPVIISSRRDMGFWHTPAHLRMIRILNRLTDRVLANSESVRQNAAQKEKIPLDRIDVIYNGLPPDHFEGGLAAGEAKKELGVDPSSPVVGIVSNLNREVKRVDVFLDAVPLVIERIPDARFVVIGKGSLRASLEERCRSLGVAAAVTFTGGIRHIHRLLSGLDVGVNCSDSEGLSNAVIEYMMAGVPAVVSDVPGNRELIAEGPLGWGCYFPPGDSSSLAEVLVKLLEAPRLCREMAERGRKEAIRRFSADSMIRNYMEYYEALATKPLMKTPSVRGGAGHNNGVNG